MITDDFKMQKGNPGALINTNLELLEEYKQKREKLSEEESKKNNLDNLKQDVDTIKNELSDLKSLLLKVLEK